jgi:branched-chain amino acid transport system ATP-binding protein
MTTAPLLQVDNVHTYYGRSHVLHGASLVLDHGAIALIGRNGMGKTTLVRTIMGLAPAAEGRVLFEGRDITRMKPFQIAAGGIGYVPQGRQTFPSLSVTEHLTMAYRRGRGMGWNVDTVFELFPRLGERAQQSGTSLSGGEQQMLAIGRALVTNPTLLIMDEPSEGLAPVILDLLTRTYRSLVEKGINILLVEQNLRTAAALADEMHVMLSGEVVDRVSSAALLADRALRERYLGVTSKAQAGIASVTGGQGA